MNKISKASNSSPITIAETLSATPPLTPIPLGSLEAISISQVEPPKNATSPHTPLVFDQKPKLTDHVISTIETEPWKDPEIGKIRLEESAAPALVKQRHSNLILANLCDSRFIFDSSDYDSYLDSEKKTSFDPALGSISELQKYVPESPSYIKTSLKKIIATMAAASLDQVSLTLNRILPSSNTPLLREKIIRDASNVINDLELLHLEQFRPQDTADQANKEIEHRIVKELQDFHSTSDDSDEEIEIEIRTIETPRLKNEASEIERWSLSLLRTLTTVATSAKNITAERAPHPPGLDHPLLEQKAVSAAIKTYLEVYKSSYQPTFNVLFKKGFIDVLREKGDSMEATHYSRELVHLKAALAAELATKAICKKLSLAATKPTVTSKKSLTAEPSFDRPVRRQPI